VKRRVGDSTLTGARTGRVTRVAFGIIVAFVLAQVTWWLIFPNQLLDRAARERTEAWARDAATANELLELDPGAADGLLARYPHLRLAPGAAEGLPRIELDPARVLPYAERDRAARRMLAFEGPFFAVVILGMLALIAGSLRAERELKRRQHNFLGAVTHEFNTPLGTLRLLVQTLRLRPATPERTVDYLRRMETELDRLERTTEQVLASARLEQAGAPPALAAADLNTVVQGLIGRARDGLEARGARLTVRYAAEPLPVSLEPDAFALVLNNLLDNAVKYSPGAVKPVTVTLRADGDVVRLHVDDQGVGLLPAERERVFERFYRAGDEMTRTSAGVGLGLHLVRSTTEAMNGWVQVEDTPSGRGTRFTVVLPRRVMAGDDDPRPAAPAAGPRYSS
jgi:two-component system, OmpR family, sensor histidine kinase SenX3